MFGPFVFVYALFGVCVCERENSLCSKMHAYHPCPCDMEWSQTDEHDMGSRREIEWGHPRSCPVSLSNQNNKGFQGIYLFASSIPPFSTLWRGCQAPIHNDSIVARSVSFSTINLWPCPCPCIPKTPLPRSEGWRCAFRHTLNEQRAEKKKKEKRAEWPFWRWCAVVSLGHRFHRHYSEPERGGSHI